MAKKVFNPADFLNQDTPAATAPKQTTSTPFIPSSDLAADIQSLVEQVEASAIDITVGYKQWLDIGFALVDALGEDGRDFFHRLSCFNAGYNPSEADKQYTSCLRAHGSGITSRTLFHIAQQHGITIHGHLDQPSISPTSSVSSKGDLEETEDLENRLEQMAMSTFYDKVSEQLPDFLKQVGSLSTSVQDADMLILGTITAISACLPNVSGIYDSRVVYPNLFLFVTAPASAGKGRLTLCRLIIQPIHEILSVVYESQMEEYGEQVLTYETNGHQGEPPQKPKRRVLFIPANSSASKFSRTLYENGETGIVFETEGDTLANTFKNDYGNYSDSFRKAFHHEHITHNRVKDDEYIEIKKPRLSALLSGTPRQIQTLIQDAENGLFSRFMFYYLKIDLEWHNVFDCNDQTPVDKQFDLLGKRFYTLYQCLLGSEPISFGLTESQQQQFCKEFQEIQTDYVKVLGLSFLASVRRFGLITFRIAMILSVLRICDDGVVSNPIVCCDDDFNTALNIAKTLLQHTSRVFQGLPNDASSNPVRQMTQIRQNFFNALPAQFNRASYTKIAGSLGIPPKTADKYVKSFVDRLLITHEAQNKYAKK